MNKNMIEKLVNYKRNISWKNIYSKIILSIISRLSFFHFFSLSCVN